MHRSAMIQPIMHRHKMKRGSHDALQCGIDNNIIDISMHNKRRKVNDAFGQGVPVVAVSLQKNADEPLSFDDAFHGPGVGHVIIIIILSYSRIKCTA